MKKIFVTLILLALIGAGIWFWKGKEKKPVVSTTVAEFVFPREYQMVYSRIIQQQNFLPDGTIGLQRIEGGKETLYFTPQKRRTEFGDGSKVVILNRDAGYEYELNTVSKTYLKKKISVPEDSFDMLTEAKWKPFANEKNDNPNGKKYKYAAVRQDRAGFLLTCWLDAKGVPAQIGHHVLEGIDENERYPEADQFEKIDSFKAGPQDPKLFEIPSDFKEINAPPMQIPNIPKVGMQPGDKVPDFTITGIDGKKYSLSDFKNTGVVLEWFNYDCPYVKKFYESGEMQAIQKEYVGRSGISWITICSSPKDKWGYLTSEKAAEFLKNNNSLATTYVIDEDGQLGKKYGVKVTPHVFVINHGQMIYSGSIDPIATTEKQHAGKIKNYLRNALQAVVEGRWPTTLMVEPYGSPIPYEEKK